MVAGKKVLPVRNSISSCEKLRGNFYCQLHPFSGGYDTGIICVHFAASIPRRISIVTRYGDTISHSHIMHLRVQPGRIYLVVMIDLYPRRVMGRSMDRRMTNAAAWHNLHYEPQR